MSIDIPQLQRGDHLIYSPSDLFGWLIAIKTWSLSSHIEIYIGEGRSVAARTAGVNVYPVRYENLTAILRPIQKPDLDAAMLWFYSHAKGQAYDYFGMLVFYLAAKQGDKSKMFCSEFATRFDRAAGLTPFHACFDADHIAPGNFFMSPAFEWVMANR